MKQRCAKNVGCPMASGLRDDYTFNYTRKMHINEGPQPERRTAILTFEGIQPEVPSQQPDRINHS
jgi:hypothetical protein